MTDTTRAEAQVIAAGFDGSDWKADLAGFREDLLLADLEIVTGRVERLRESVKKPRPNRDQEIVELAALEQVLATLESGKALPASSMTEDQLKATRSFRLLTEKPTMVILNVADDAELDLRHATGSVRIALRITSR